MQPLQFHLLLIFHISFRLVPSSVAKFYLIEILQSESQECSGMNWYISYVQHRLPIFFFFFFFFWCDNKHKNSSFSISPSWTNKVIINYWLFKTGIPRSYHLVFMSEMAFWVKAQRWCSIKTIKNSDLESFWKSSRKIEKRSKNNLYYTKLEQGFIKTL